MGYDLLTCWRMYEIPGMAITEFMIEMNMADAIKIPFAGRKEHVL